jgi:hypothetical protein
MGGTVKICSPAAKRAVSERAIEETHRPFLAFPKQVWRFWRTLLPITTVCGLKPTRMTIECCSLSPSQAFVLTVGACIAADLERHSLRYAYRRKGRIDASVPGHPFQPGQEPVQHSPQRSFLGGEPEKDRAGVQHYGFQIEATGMALMTGIFKFPPAMLAAYWEAVRDEREGAALEDILETVRRAGHYAHCERTLSACSLRLCSQPQAR